MCIFELRKGQIIQDKDTNELFLVLSIKVSYITCMNQKFNEVKIGLAYINDYSLYDELDIFDFIEWLKRRVEEVEENDK